MLLYKRCVRCYRKRGVIAVNNFKKASVFCVVFLLVLLGPAVALAQGDGGGAALMPYTATDAGSKERLSKETLAGLKQLKAGTDYVEDEALFLAASRSQAEQTAKKYGAVLQSYSDFGLAVIKLPKEQPVTAALEANARQLAGSEPLLSPNYLYHVDDTVQYIPNDPHKGLQYSHEDMEDYAAWDITKGSGSVLVAIIDTGIDLDHPEFSGRISALAYNARDRRTGLVYVDDDQGHGTHVAGIIAAAQNNGIGGSGVAPGVKILPIKANEPISRSFSTTSIINGIVYAADSGASVLNMSLGRSYYTGPNNAEYAAIQYAVSKGVLIVCAAGNDAEYHVGYPSAYEECVAVTALAQGGIFDKSYSNYGPEADISAPGTDILSCYPDKTIAFLSGTSMACPQVAGVAALVKSVNPSYSASQIRNKLLNTATDRGAAGVDNLYGYGMVNSYHSVVTYKVTFNSRGGSGIAAMKAGYNDKLTALPTPTYGTNHFTGWYKDTACTAAWNPSVDRVRSNLTLYARWVPDTVMVTFNSMGGSAVAGKSVKFGTAIAAPANPSRKGYTFGGWYKESSCTNKWSFSTPVKDHMTLYAKWTLITYTVTLNYQDGRTSTAVKVVPNALLPQPKAPTRDGFVFKGWFVESSCYTPWVFGSYPVTQHMTLYAKWLDTRFKPWNITGLSGSLIGPMGIDVGSDGNIYVIDNQRRVLVFNSAGSLVRQWTCQASVVGDSGRLYSITVDEKANVYVGAQYKILKYSSKGDLLQEMLNFKVSSGPTSLAVDSQGNIYVADGFKILKFKKDGTILWNRGESGYPGYGGSTSGTGTDSFIPSPVAVLSKDKIRAVQNSKYSQGILGYNADGSPDGYALSLADANFYTPIQMEANAKDQLYTVNWSSNKVTLLDGSTVVSQWGAYGSGINQFNGPSDLALDSHGNVYVADTNNHRIMRMSPPVTTYTVKYNAQGGSAVRYMLATAGRKLIAPRPPTRTGYVFAGWYREAACTNAWNFDTDKVTANITLYAKWTMAAPAAPKAASTGYNSVKVSWNAVAGASGYQVWRSKTPSGGYTLAATVAGTSSTSTGLATGTTYYFKIRAYRTVNGAKVYGAYTAAVSAKPALAVPASPKATSASYNSVKVTWSPVPGAGGYQVWRSTGSGYTLAATVAGTTSTSTGLATGTTYYYKIRAYRTVNGAKVYGAYTATVSAKPVPASPSGLKAVRASSSSIKLTWSAVAGATKHEVYRAASSSGTYTRLTETTGLTCTSTGLAKGKTYYYKIRAYRLVGSTKVYGGYSLVVSATP